MALGIPGTESSSGGGGEFLGRLQYDARVGFWKVVKRVQGPDGRWTSDAGDFFPAPLTFLMDTGSLEVGYIKIDGAPTFVLAPFGGTVPPQPQEMKIDPTTGKSRKAFQPGFRIKVMSPKTFGDADAYYFSANSKTVLQPMDDLIKQVMAAPEAAHGLIPVVKVTGKTAIKAGESTFYAPAWEIVSWQPRPAVFGERLVPPPGGGSAPAAAPAPAPATAAPANHVPPPAAPKAPEPAMADAGMPDEW